MIYPIKNQQGRVVLTILFLGFIAFILYGNRDIVAYLISKSAREIINENRELKKVISNLTEEDQIGYAKVLSQKTRNGRMFTKLRFVETDKNDPQKKTLEKEYQIEGDVIHFDALIIKFSNQLVMDGKEKAIYLWRRVYGEKMNPEDGFPIECEGEEPKRYADIFSKFSIVDKNEFWKKIWSLGNDPDRLREEGVQAIYGNVILRKSGQTLYTYSKLIIKVVFIRRLCLIYRWPGMKKGSQIIYRNKLETNRWLRALGIAKVVFDDEGYHIAYLQQIEDLIRREIVCIPQE